MFIVYRRHSLAAAAAVGSYSSSSHDSLLVGPALFARRHASAAAAAFPFPFPATVSGLVLRRRYDAGPTLPPVPPPLPAAVVQSVRLLSSELYVQPAHRWTRIGLSVGWGGLLEHCSILCFCSYTLLYISSL